MNMCSNNCKMLPYANKYSLYLQNTIITIITISVAKPNLFFRLWLRLQLIIANITFFKLENHPHYGKFIDFAINILFLYWCRSNTNYGMELLCNLQPEPKLYYSSGFSQNFVSLQLRPRLHNADNNYNIKYTIE
jgi:hypothetical protein